MNDIVVQETRIVTSWDLIVYPCAIHRSELNLPDPVVPTPSSEHTEEDSDSLPATDLALPVDFLPLPINPTTSANAMRRTIQIIQQSLHEHLQASFIELQFNIMFAYKLRTEV
jgi:hypothetical protein